MPRPPVKRRYVESNDKEYCFGCNRLYSVDYMLLEKHIQAFACIRCYNEMKATLERNREAYAKEGDTPREIITRIFESFKEREAGSKDLARASFTHTMGTLTYHPAKAIWTRGRVVNGTD